MNQFLAIAIAFAICVPTAMIAAYADKRCGALDIASGRRSGFDVAQDYGSNRGFYWPWSPLYLLSMLCCVVPGGFLVLTFALWVLYR